MTLPTVLFFQPSTTTVARPRDLRPGRCRPWPATKGVNRHRRFPDGGPVTGSRAQTDQPPTAQLSEDGADQLTTAQSGCLHVSVLTERQPYQSSTRKQIANVTWPAHRAVKPESHANDFLR